MGCLSKILTTLIILGFGAVSLAVGFASGNEFSITPISGQVFVNCQNGTTHFERCYAESFDPVTADFFIGPQSVSADTVNLKCTHQNGSVESKTTGYDSNSGKSSKRFNLGIRTLLQTPLLDMGLNKIDYIMLKAGKTVDSGQFSVLVKEGKSLTCETRHIWENGTINECNNSFSACQRYFQEVTDCR